MSGIKTITHRNVVDWFEALKWADVATTALGWRVVSIVCDLNGTWHVFVEHSVDETPDAWGEAVAEDER